MDRKLIVKYFGDHWSGLSSKKAWDVRIFSCCFISLNIFEFWTKGGNCRCHSGLWENLMNIFHCFVTFNQMIIQNSQQLEMTLNREKSKLPHLRTGNLGHLFVNKLICLSKLFCVFLCIEILLSSINFLLIQLINEWTNHFSTREVHSHSRNLQWANEGERQLGITLHLRESLELLQRWPGSPAGSTTSAWCRTSSTRIWEE